MLLKGLKLRLQSLWSLRKWRSSKTQLVSMVRAKLTPHDHPGPLRLMCLGPFSPPVAYREKHHGQSPAHSCAGPGETSPPVLPAPLGLCWRDSLHMKLVATRREMFPERHLETEGGGGGLMWYPPEIPTSHFLECEWVSRVNSRAV